MCLSRVSSSGLFQCEQAFAHPGQLVRSCLKKKAGSILISHRHGPAKEFTLICHCTLNSRHPAILVCVKRVNHSI